MKSNVNLIYALIQKDLKAEGWDDVSIAEAIAECQRERQATGADDSTICVKEMSYLSQESLQKNGDQALLLQFYCWHKSGQKRNNLPFPCGFPSDSEWYLYRIQHGVFYAVP